MRRACRTLGLGRTGTLPVAFPRKAISLTCACGSAWSATPNLPKTLWQSRVFQIVYTPRFVLSETLEPNLRQVLHEQTIVTVAPGRACSITATILHVSFDARRNHYILWLHEICLVGKSSPAQNLPGGGRDKCVDATETYGMTCYRPQNIFLPR